MEPVFRGVGVALITLFDEGGDLLAEATADLAARLVGCGVAAVVVAGSTGEAEALTPAERVAVLRAVRAGVPAATPVIAGTGAPSARQAAELTRAAAGEGADAVLALSPPGTADPRGYYAQVAEAAHGLPVLAYHFPAKSAPGIPVDALGDLPVAGMKDSSGDPERLLAELQVWDRPVWPGAATLISTAAALGCPGVILALANAEPERCVAAWGGDWRAQQALAPAHLASRRAFPAGIKGLVAERFGTPAAARLG